MSIEDVGCCGAYCRTCKVIKEEFCQGCKIGYSTGVRAISKAKCRIKVCCLRKGFYSCADCGEYDACDIIKKFFAKNGYKYKKYKQALDYIRENGYEKFISIADGWKMQYGKYK